VTPSSANVSFWNDSDRIEGAVIASSILGAEDSGIYHEDEAQPTAQTKNADTLYEEDFAISITSTGNYYIRTVSLDQPGGNATVLDLYSKNIEISASVPLLEQGAWKWASDASPQTFSGTDNTQLDFTVGANYIIAIRLDNSGAATPTNNWQVQYQSDPDGSPGAWTTINSSSTDWKVFNGIGKVDLAPVSGNATTIAHGTLVFEDGMYAESSTGAVASLSAVRYTEYWFAVQPQTVSADTTYRFRITNSGSASGITYTSYIRAVAISAPSNNNQIDQIRRPVIFFHGMSY
jgi:hypothetical protein